MIEVEQSSETLATDDRPVSRQTIGNVGPKQKQIAFTLLRPFLP
jgi:hypothetical protein